MTAPVSAQDLLDQVARAATGDAPIDPIVAIARARARRRRAVARGAATTVLLLTLVAGAAALPRWVAGPALVYPAGSPRAGAPWTQLPADSGRVLLPDQLRLPRLDPPSVIDGDGKVRAARLTMALTGSVRGRDVVLGVDAATARLVRLPATDADLPGLGIRSDDLVKSVPQRQVVLSPGGTVAAVITVHRGGCWVAVLDLGRGQVSAIPQDCATSSSDPQWFGGRLLPMDDGSLVHVGPDGTVRRSGVAPSGAGNRGALPRWQVTVDADLAGARRIVAAGADRALLVTQGEPVLRVRLLDLSTGSVGEPVRNLPGRSDTAILPAPAGPLWFVSTEGTLNREDPVTTQPAADGPARPALPAVPIPAVGAADGSGSGNELVPSRLVGVNRGSALLVDGESGLTVGRASTLAALDPRTGRITRWMTADLGVPDGWSFPVALISQARVVPTPAEPWWSWLMLLNSPTGWFVAVLVVAGCLLAWWVWRRDPKFQLPTKNGSSWIMGHNA